jgi:hypothetical protein
MRRVSAGRSGVRMARKQPLTSIAFGTLVLVAVTHGGACARSSVVDPDGSRVAVGEWGGEHVGLTVTNTGARLEFDCASGEISQPLTLDNDGRFSVEGVYTQERPGPVRIGDEPERKAARYSGRIAGKTMTLDVILIESKKNIGTFMLTFGGEPRVTKCL